MEEFVTGLESLSGRKEEEMRWCRMSKIRVSRKPTAPKVAERLAGEMEN